jgi:multiple sugar transport system ATP-binding protein
VEVRLAEVILENVTKVYPGDVVAVNDISLHIADRELLVLVGPSGCGKSTTLRMIAGLEDVTKGTIRIGDRVVNDVPPKDRDIAMVFQNYALYPHMTVYRNMSFALRLRGFPRKEIDERVNHAAALLGIQNLLERKPKALSGGQRQRVAVGRAIVRKPAVFLFDEPLSNLDAKLRVQMRSEISKLHAQYNRVITKKQWGYFRLEVGDFNDYMDLLKKKGYCTFKSPRGYYVQITEKGEERRKALKSVLPRILHK